MRWLPPLLGWVLVASSCLPADNALERAAEEMTAELFPLPREMPDAILLDQHGQPFDMRTATRGQLTLLFFGYTNCPDVCPITMGSVGGALALLTPEERARVGAVFVTLDPNRDDTEQVGRWLAGIDSTIVGLTGSQAEIDGVLAQFRLAMPPTEVPSEGPYAVAHPATLFLFTPEGLARFGYSYGNTAPEVIAEDLRLLSAAVWNPTGDS